MLDSVFGTGKNYYPQVFLEEYKYFVKGKKIPKSIIDDKKISSDSDRQNSGRENSYEGNSDEGHCNEENFAEKKLKILIQLIFKAYFWDL